MAQHELGSLYELKAAVEERIERLELQVGVRQTDFMSPVNTGRREIQAPATPTRKTMSDAARTRIGAAQRKRWADKRKAEADAQRRAEERQAEERRARSSRPAVTVVAKKRTSRPAARKAAVNGAPGPDPIAAPGGIDFSEITEE